jgi:L-2-hydroxyglutarate oxidase LhgO
MQIKHEYDFAILGGGVIGLAIANELIKFNPDLNIVVVEKENEVAEHASGRNSGVLHAGFYYSPDSLKAKLTLDGNRYLHEFCLSNNIPVLNTGKVVVTQNSDELSALDELLNRGISNGVRVEMISEEELKKIEPVAKTFKRALWSPNTSVANPSQVVQQMASNFINAGGKVLLNSIARISSDHELSINGSKVKANHVINATGLYADKVAKRFGFADGYTMLPFIGLYFYAPKYKDLLNSHIYPVPDPRNPFLGVHLTKTVSGDTKIGPTAIPIISREQYSAFGNLKFDEFAEILKTYPKFFFSKHHDVVSLLRTEIPKFSKGHLAKIFIERKAWDTSPAI